MNELDPREARDLLDGTERETRAAVEPRTSVLFAVWGAAWLIGYLALWISTTDQDPYRGPAGWAYAILAVSLFGAAVMTAVTIGRSTGGISGPSSRTGAFYGITWAVAFSSWGVVFGAVQDTGIPDAAGGLLGAALPAVLVAVIYCASAGALEEPAMFSVGVALAIVTMVGVWTGPATVCLVLGVGGGLAFIAAAAASRHARLISS